MRVNIFEENINGTTLTQMHDAALKALIRAYNPEGTVYVSREDLDNMAWEAVIKIYERKDTYVKKGMSACGLACTIAHNDLMTYLVSAMRRNMSTVPMEIVNTDKGLLNTADTETGRKFTLTGIGVGREFDTTFGECMEVIEQEIDKLPAIERQIYELMLDKVPQKEIASICGLSYVNVRKKWYDIRKKLLKNNYILSRVHEMGLAG